MEGDVITLSDLFTFDYAAGIDDEGRFAGSIRPTGLRPTSPTGSTTTASSSRPSCSTWNGCGSSAPPPRPAAPLLAGAGARAGGGTMRMRIAVAFACCAASS